MSTVPNHSDSPYDCVEETLPDRRELLQEKSKARHDESESHQRQARANPCEQSSLSGEIIAKLTRLLRSRRRIHFAAFLAAQHCGPDAKAGSMRCCLP